MTTCEDCGVNISVADVEDAHYDDSGAYHEECYERWVMSQQDAFAYVRQSREQIFEAAMRSSQERYGYYADGGDA